ncbi:hypothetical protein GW777_05845 [Candidatus Peregrinibacteria bacterium]|nr:hypothetical protein [bacterium]NCQ55808.1 hypothetical protein [Candidatus Parcubacteria bacterium]NCS67875.1 hypothetical protein [Candidatus Peregrinibacteria bacterium]
MPLDNTRSFLPHEALIIRGARTPAGNGTFDGWRSDLKAAGLLSVQVPGSDYWPHIDHKTTAVEVCRILAQAEQPQLLLCHSYGGNIAFQVLRAVPALQEKVAAIIHMASPLKLQMGIFPEPAPDLQSPVIGFRGLHDGTVPVYYTGSRIDTSLFEIDCGHQDFVSNEAVRAQVLAVLQAQLSPVRIEA